VVAIRPAVAVAIARGKRIGIIGIEAHAVEEIILLINAKILTMTAPMGEMPVVKFGAWEPWRVAMSSGVRIVVTEWC